MLKADEGVRVKSRLLRAFEFLPIWVATAGFLFTSAAYGWFHGAGRPLLGMDARWLVAVVRVEFLAVHSFPFVMLVALRRPRLPQYQGLRVLMLGLLFLMYFALAHSVAGWQGVFLFASLAAITYLGFLVNLEAGIRKFPELGLRWLCNYVLLVFLATWFQLPSEAASWSIEDGILSVGGLYFLALAGLELSGLYQKPFLLEFGRAVAERSTGVGTTLRPQPALPAGHGPLYWASAPILGCAGLCFLPLFLSSYLAGAGARFIDDWLEWPLSASVHQWWFPFVMALVLLAARGYQFHLLTKGRTRKRILSILAASYFLVAVLRVRADPTYHFAYSLFPEDAYEGFLLLEVPLLLVLVPATWWVLAFPEDFTRSTRTSASGS